MKILYMGTILFFLFVYDCVTTWIQKNGTWQRISTSTATWQLRQPWSISNVDNGAVVNHRPYSTLLSDFIIHATATLPIPRPFPRWGNSIEDETTYGIDAKPLLDFIVNASMYAHAPKSRREQQKHSHTYVATSDHQNDVNHWFPETLYVITKDGIFTSQLHHDVMNEQGKATVRDKVIPAEQIMAEAWKMLRRRLDDHYHDATNTTTTSVTSDDDDDDAAWPHLRQSLMDGHEIPFLAWYGDYTGCNFHNWKNKFSIPLFTLAARVDCSYAFPFPTYRTIGDSIHQNESSWDRLFHEYRETYPWEKKRRQVVWRGGLTGFIANATHKSPRWNMVRTVQNHELFDVGATRLPKRHDAYRADLERELGGLVPSLKPMTDFMKYRGILDMDGNSWSSRFGNLLCYNSVVLKVDPTWVDYFHFRQQRTKHQNDPVLLLQPWKHYVPVRSDLSDIVQMAEFVTDPANDAILLSIAENANSWCRHNMIQNQVARDVLDIWEAYVQLLANGNEKNRFEESWKSAKRQIFAPDSLLDMIKLS